MFTVESLKNIQLIFPVQLHMGENQMNTKIAPGGGGMDIQTPCHRPYCCYPGDNIRLSVLLSVRGL